jgi:hypothetical protein
MGVILKAESGTHLAINWWNWRPIVELLLRQELVDSQLAEMLQTNGVGVSLDRTGALAASRLVADLVSTMPPGSCLLRNGTIDVALTEPQPLADFNERWYCASREVLEKFATFCADVDGFVVL